jgi:hypothetical protein
MAIRIPIITDLQDKGIKDAKKAFGDFKASVANAEGGLGKFKAGSKSIMDSVGANAAGFAVAGGIAFAKFAADGVKAYQDLALGAEKFATSTGLSIQDASRYIEAAGDIGVPIDAVEGAIGRLNKTIGADPDKVRELGVDLVYLKDGSLDVNATFLNTIERIKGIKDPAEKAKVAAQLLGKGWQSMSTLIEMGADDLSTALSEVSDAKVISPEELKKAKEFRDVMDDLKGKIEDLSLSIGTSLVPVLSQVGEIIKVGTGIRDFFKSIPGATWMSENLSPLGLTKAAIGGVADATGAVIGWFKDSPSTIEKFIDHMGKVDFTTSFLGRTIDSVRKDSLAPLKITLNDTWKEVKNVDTAWRELIGVLETDVAIDNARTSLDELGVAAAQAFATGSTEDVAAYREQLLLATTDIMNLALDMDDISSHQVKVLVDKGDLEGALALIERIKAFQKTYANVSDPYAAMAGAANLSSLAGLDFSGFRAAGGPVGRGNSYIVGERGPELFTPGASGSITPNNAMGGSNITVNVTSANPDDVVAALQRWVRNNGSLALSTTAGVRF